MDGAVSSIVAECKGLTDTAQRNMMRNNFRGVDQAIENKPDAFVIEATHIDVALRLRGINIDPLAMNFQEVNGIIGDADASIHNYFPSKGSAIDRIYHAVAFEQTWNYHVKALREID